MSEHRLEDCAAFGLRRGVTNVTLALDDCDIDRKERCWLD
jgi:hypothetical protein